MLGKIFEEGLMMYLAIMKTGEYCTLQEMWLGLFSSEELAKKEIDRFKTSKQNGYPYNYRDDNNVDYQLIKLEINQRIW